MPLEWGRGLVDLTEKYLILKNYIVARSVVYEVYTKRDNRKPPSPTKYQPSYFDIDLVAFKGLKEDDFRGFEVLLVECTQSNIKQKKAEKIVKEMNKVARFDIYVNYDLPKKETKIHKWITYDTMDEKRKKFFKNQGCVLKSANEMLLELVEHVKEKPELKRPEALVWLLQTLERSGLLKKK